MSGIHETSCSDGRLAKLILPLASTGHPNLCVQASKTKHLPLPSSMAFQLTKYARGPQVGYPAGPDVTSGCETPETIDSDMNAT